MNIHVVVCGSVWGVPAVKISFLAMCQPWQLCIVLARSGEWSEGM